MKGIIFISMLLILAQETYAWDNFMTHPQLTDKAIASWKQFDPFLKKLGFQNGVDQSFRGKIVAEIIAKGSDLEDIPGEERSVNHFHNPTRELRDAGLDDYIKLKKYFNFTGQSTVVWAKGMVGYPDLNEYDYRDFKRFYEKALNGVTRQDRDEAAEQMFSTLGHLLHLVQDMAVPAHARNDLSPGHASTFKTRGKVPAGSDLEYYLERHPELIKVVPEDKIPRLGSFEMYFDTGTYRTNGFVPVSGLSVGLAEYANSNFVSEGTIFPENSLPKKRSPHPAVSDVYEWYEASSTSENLEHLVGQLPEVFYRSYFGVSSAEFEKLIDHLLNAGFFYRALSRNPLMPNQIDSACHLEYLQKLVPKAVGYSAGLLAYMYRGDIEFEYDSPASNFKITNRSEEPMQGQFTCYYDKADGTRAMLPGASWTLSIGAGQSVNTAAVTLPRDMGVTKTLALFFEGQLGAETDAVAGAARNFGTFTFTYDSHVTPYEIPYPDVWNVMKLSNPPTSYLRSYGYSLQLNLNWSSATVYRRDFFYPMVQAPPDVCKQLGFDPAVPCTFNIATASRTNLVEYFKVSPAPDKWEYVWDASGMHAVNAYAGDISWRLIYYDGLWREPYYRDMFLGTPTIWDTDCELTFDPFPREPFVSVDLVYDLNLVPQCPNAEELIATASSFYPQYLNLYRYSIQANQQYLPMLFSDNWKAYGFEVRYSQIVADNPEARNGGLIFNQPVTIRKDYGSNQLTVW